MPPTSSSRSGFSPHCWRFSGNVASVDDPEIRRVAELLAREHSGTIDEAEREELALYHDQPETLAQARRHLPALLGSGQVAGGGDQAWLARVQHDQQLAQAEQSPRARIERGIGVTLLLAGWLTSMAGSPLGGAMAVFGVVLVLGSFIRVRRSGPRDPYDEIRQ
jgi:hypothetical protein